jgi:hypothetical protein
VLEENSRADIQSHQVLEKPIACMVCNRNNHETEWNARVVSTLRRRVGTLLACKCLAEAWTSLKLS